METDRFRRQLINDEYYIFCNSDVLEDDMRLFLTVLKIQEKENNCNLLGPMICTINGDRNDNKK